MPRPVEIRNRDYVEARFAWAGRRHPSFAAGVFGWVVLIAGAAWLLLHRVHQRNPLSSVADALRHARYDVRLAIIGFVVSAFIVLFIWFVIFRVVRSYAGPKRVLTLVEIAPDGISLTKGNVQRVTTWRMFTSFIETPRLYVMRQRTGQLLVVPKASFNSQAEEESFRQELNANLVR